MKNSPYISEEDRLGDVISAIQTLGTYRFYKLTPDQWSQRISGDAPHSKKWATVFKEHPEFFRLSGKGDKVCLVLRRQKPKLFDVDTLQTITRDERNQRDVAGQSRVTRAPLTENELQLLVTIAGNLHSKALDDRRDSRWWMPYVMTAVSASIGLFGVWLGAALKAPG